MTYTITEKGRNLFKTKLIDGVEYALMDENEEKEIWVRLSIDEPDKCSRCGYTGAALQTHHIHGRKSKDTILLCANCHVEHHRGQ